MNDVNEAAHGYRERPVLVARLLHERPECEACHLIRLRAPLFRCGGRSVDVHDVKTRGRGGDFLDEENVLAVCRQAHNWIGNNQQAALDLGLLLHSWEETVTAAKRRAYARMMERTTETETGCVVFTGYRNRKGYSSVRCDGRNEMGHRLAYEVMVGPIPDGMFVCHRCDNPPCVNPEHLFVGSPAENSADMVAKGRSPRQRGEASGKARLTDDDVREMADLRREGVPLKDIAARFGVSGPHVSRILRGKRRQWTDGLDLSGIDTSQRDPATDEIVAMREAGATTTEIAARFGKNTGTVWRILKRAAPHLVGRQAHSHPREAHELGLLRASWEAP